VELDTEKSGTDCSAPTDRKGSDRKGAFCLCWRSRSGRGVRRWSWTPRKAEPAIQIWQGDRTQQKRPGLTQPLVSYSRNEDFHSRFFKSFSRFRILISQSVFLLQPFVSRIPQIQPESEQHNVIIRNSPVKAQNRLMGRFCFISLITPSPPLFQTNGA
jgi:hypothetical protein